MAVMKLPPVEPVSVEGAACTIYRDTPSWQGRTAAIGAFTCANGSDGAAILSQMAEQLQQEGFDGVIGPMDGDTWHTYRVISETDRSPPFFLEPVSGPFDLAAFKRAGFAPISSYVSTRADINKAIAVPAPGVAGVTIAAWDGQDGEALINDLFDLSRAVFADNAFYKPITREEFLELYRPIIPTIDPRLVYFANVDGHLAGFLFALPNLVEGDKPATVILKT